MKNKKGFTLIEIMAVIIILSIIALIVVPLVTGSIKSSKDKLYDTQIENIKSAAKSYMINLDLDDTQNKMLVTIEELKKLGLVDKDIKDPRTGEEFNKCLTVEVTKNGNIYDYNIIDDIEDCSETGSVIMTLIGSLNETTTKNKEYIDAGVILKTDKGQYLDINDITVEIIQYKDNQEIKTMTGKYSDLTTLIDTSDYYKYKITYIYDGIEGKASKVRNLEVVDTNNLECIILPVTEANENGWVTEDRKAQIMSINTNRKVEYSISETNEKNYSDNPILNVSKDGKVKIYGYIKDNMGNEAACTRTIKFETEEVGCNINMTGTQLVEGWYTSDVIANLVPNIVSDIVTQGMSLNEQIDYNNQTTIEITTSGNVYGFVKDEAGKENVCSSDVKIDKTEPIVSLTATSTGVSNYNTQSITLTASASDPESGISKYEFYDGTKLLGSNTTGVYIVSSLPNSASNYKVKVYNNAGLYSEATITETCSVNSSLSSDTCTNGYKTIVYTCTGTNRQYGITQSCETGESCTPWHSCSCSAGPGTCANIPEDQNRQGCIDAMISACNKACSESGYKAPSGINVSGSGGCN